MKNLLSSQEEIQMKTSGEVLSRRFRIIVAAAIVSFICVIFVYPSQASFVCNFDIFNSGNGHNNDPGANMFVVVSVDNGEVDFTFHNENSFKSSIARIYFETGSLGDILSITNGPGTNFSEDFPGPGNLPGGHSLNPSFNADISIGAHAPPPKNGINPTEWITVSFDLPAGQTEETIADELYSGQMRMGLHALGLPDGSSVSAISTPSPEPATLSLIGLGALSLFAKRSKFKPAFKGGFFYNSRRTNTV
jgi:hypothetical protein